MTKIKSLDDLRQRKQQLEQSMEIRENSDHPDSLVQIKVAMATCGIASGARAVMNAFVEKIKKEKIPAVVTQTGCMGYCYAEPTVEVKKPGMDPVVFSYVDVAKAEEIVDKYIRNNELLDGILPANYQTI
ncbi:MAG TPA: (2Fe-2S) ferredoxin domain-containing protein [Bacteroidales bacterium]|nr:(2Fe-2S) ferredoxin domain-containing protein [Bacteroidales bacterium]MCZ2416294.1 (2Fe-2S) ferredoxin domain-containing protein [Burkholderiales bacterium]OQC56920.1 MAG: NADP-reducing hydrogenase subunit HndB [Bacteroidetes bacterium ADurb.Bin013]MBP8998692.1 (2Fe-2S) ferredoxin domain-containing protein [Bacteroidales bacterium]MBV6456495.1 NADP-reducing hydrogenase subunit HndB [Bacteroidales bacterium]